MANTTERLKHLVRNIFLIPVYIYRGVISPYLGPSCIYSPTCSAYMLDAVHKHGIAKGFILGITRIFRCNRAFMGGPDPVPDVFSWKQIKDSYIIFRKPKKRRKDRGSSPTDPSTTP